MSKKRLRPVPKPSRAPAAIQPAPSISARVLTWGPCVLAFLIYMPALRFGFVYDDHKQIVDNSLVHSWAYIPQIFSTYLWNQKFSLGFYYRPIFSLWLLIVHTFGGLSPWFWHLSNALLHGVATYWVLQICLEVLGSPATASFAALLFAVHPIHVEPVCWVSASDEILYTLFVLVSLLLFVRALRAPVDAGRRTAFSLAAWALALLSKETAIAVLPLFFFVAYKSTNNSTERRMRWRRAFRAGAPYLVVAAVYVGLRFMVLMRTGLEGGTIAWHQVFYTSPSIFVFYMRKLLVPVGLSEFYGDPVFSAPTVAMWITVLFILVGLFAVLWIALKRGLAFGFATGLLFLPIFPVLVGMRLFGRDLAHDRYMYLPSVGACLLAGMLARVLWKHGQRTRIAVAAVSTCVVAILAVLTVAQQPYYHDDERLYRRAVDIDPRNVYAIDLLGDFYYAQGQLPRAIEQFARARNVEPENPRTTVFLIKGLFANQQYAAAEPYLQQVVYNPRLSPEQRWELMVALGQVDIELGHFPSAETVLNRLRSENETYPNLHFTLGELYRREGRIPEAQSEYAREFQVSGNAMAEQKAADLARQMRSNSANSHTAD
jgi:protein O-mannosyl-transferase